MRKKNEKNKVRYLINTLAFSKITNDQSIFNIFSKLMNCLFGNVDSYER